MNITFRETDDLPFPLDARRQHWLQDNTAYILHSIDIHGLPTTALSSKLSTKMNISPPVFASRGLVSLSYEARGPGLVNFSLFVQV